MVFSGVVNLLILYAMYGVNFMFCSNANSIRLEFFFIHNETAVKLFGLFSLSASILSIL